jgi:hypothetical protein
MRDGGGKLNGLLGIFLMTLSAIQTQTRYIGIVQAHIVDRYGRVYTRLLDIVTFFTGIGEVMTPREKELVDVITDLANRMQRHIMLEIDPTTNRRKLHESRQDMKGRIELALKVAAWETEKDDEI